MSHLSVTSKKHHKATVSLITRPWVELSNQIEHMRSYSIYIHDANLKIAFGAKENWPIILPDPLLLGDLKQTFCHNISDHGAVFLSIDVVIQLSIDEGRKLFWVSEYSDN